MRKYHVAQCVRACVRVCVCVCVCIYIRLGSGFWCQVGGSRYSNRRSLQYTLVDTPRFRMTISLMTFRTASHRSRSDKHCTDHSHYFRSGKNCTGRSQGAVGSHGDSSPRSRKQNKQCQLRLGDLLEFDVSDRDDDARGTCFATVIGAGVDCVVHQPVIFVSPLATSEPAVMPWAATNLGVPSGLVLVAGVAADVRWGDGEAYLQNVLLWRRTLESCTELWCRHVQAGAHPITTLPVHTTLLVVDLSPGAREEMTWARCAPHCCFGFRSLALGVWCLRRLQIWTDSTASICIRSRQGIG